MKIYIFFLLIGSLVFKHKRESDVFENLFIKSNYCFVKMYYLLKNSKTIDYLNYVRENIPAVLPCKSARITSGFGFRVHPLKNTINYHYGIDLVSEESDRIYSVFDGKIAYIGYNGAYGNCIKIKNDWGFEVLYGHLSSFREDLKIGDWISQNEFVGMMGATGNVTAKHLHYELKYNLKRIDPKDNLEFIQLYKLQE
ncbi:MAG: M23 family metallopeptidase [Emticicia sp.]|nr:M23 family metallopeptidase [Emticicia sp.]